MVITMAKVKLFNEKNRLKKAKCPECGKRSTVNDWGNNDYELRGCDLCGSHAAYKCPKCAKLIDGINFIPEDEAVKCKACLDTGVTLPTQAPETPDCDGNYWDGGGYRCDCGQKPTRPLEYE